MRFVHSHALGSSRAASEDRVVVVERNGVVVVAIADGAGGICGGATASDAFVRAIARALDDEAFDLHDAARWGTLLAEVDAALHVAMAGETTAIVIALSAKGITGTSVGDSEAWLVGPAGIDDLTASQHHRRLGSGAAHPAAFFRSPLDAVLVAGTDGLFKYASPDAIAVTARAGSAQSLAALARLPSGGYPDDVAVAMVRPRR